MVKLFSNKIEKKINVKIFSLTKKYTKELLIKYFRFYNWREIARAKARTDEVLQELGIM